MRRIVLFFELGKNRQRGYRSKAGQECAVLHVGGSEGWRGGRGGKKGMVTFDVLFLSSCKRQPHCIVGGKRKCAV